MANELKLFLCGDVMLGRGIDQILQYKSHPVLYESYVTNAKYYVSSTMKKYAKNNFFVDYRYIWGDLFKEHLFWEANMRIINLETSITSSQTPENKQVLYKMHPLNTEILK